MILPASSTSLLLPTRNPACRAWLPQAMYLPNHFCFSSGGIFIHPVGSESSNNRNCGIGALLFPLIHAHVGCGNGEFGLVVLEHGPGAGEMVGVHQPECRRM